jgi:hypothetical protein
MRATIRATAFVSLSARSQFTKASVWRTSSMCILIHSAAWIVNYNTQLTEGILMPSVRKVVGGVDFMGRTLLGNSRLERRCADLGSCNFNDLQRSQGAYFARRRTVAATVLILSGQGATAESRLSRH